MRIIPAKDQRYIDLVIPERGQTTFTIYDVINFCKSIIQIYTQRDIAIRERDHKLVNLYDDALTEVIENLFEFLKYRKG